jgi:hypothetical protein
VITRFIGASARGFLVLLLIMTPAIILPILGEDARQVTVLIALVAAILTMVEYGSAYPCIYEFRDAPPFNRIRFTGLYFCVFFLAVMLRGEYVPSTLSDLLYALGDRIGDLIDFPYSPVRLVVLMVPENFTTEELLLVRAAAGLAAAVAVASVLVFSVAARVNGWPLANGPFNVWVNLPTFDPTSRGDVVERLTRDGRMNILFGFLLPFLLPLVVKSAGQVFPGTLLANPHALIWTVTAWAFLPASLFARGIAMIRVAGIIAEKRRQSAQTEGGLIPA